MLYKLASGGYQLNIGPDENGAVQVNIIKEIPTRISTREGYNIYDFVGN